MTRGGSGLWADAWDSLRSRPGRTLLSIIAVSLGMGALAVLVALLGGLQERARSLVAELGGDVLAVVQGRGERTAGMTDRHARALRAAAPGARVASVRHSAARTLGTDEPLTVVGTDEHLAGVRGWKLAEGRFLDAADVARSERHAVVSTTLAEDWGWEVGRKVRVGETVFTVVGVAAIEGSAPELGLGPRVVMVPETVAPFWASVSRNPARRADALFVRAPEGKPVEWVEQRARRIFAAPDLGVTDLAYVTPKTLLGGVRRLQRGVALSVGSIAALALVLGGTTLMSLMTAGVMERVPEIGLRRALGGTTRDVAALFVVEACALTLAAGVIGVVVALMLLPVIGKALPVPAHVGPLVVLLPLVFSLAAGVVFAWWPARRAARIQPSEALRAG